jgi:hypothetical protein
MQAAGTGRAQDGGTAERFLATATTGWVGSVAAVDSVGGAEGWWKASARPPGAAAPHATGRAPARQPQEPQA